MKLKCPPCNKVVKWAETDYRPFCSKRCKLIDLGTWADEEYSMPLEDVIDLDDIN